MSPSPKRAYTSPLPDESIESLAARALPNDDLATALNKLKSWNLHIFAIRKPPVMLGSDVVFVEPPQRAGGFGLLSATIRKVEAK